MRLLSLVLISALAAVSFGAARPALAEEPPGAGTAYLNRFVLPPLAASGSATPGMTRPRASAWAFGSGVSIVELPAAGSGPGRQRAHHALSFHSETPKQMLRALGIDAAECATRLRLPSRLKQARGGAELQIQLHVGFACSF